MVVKGTLVYLTRKYCGKCGEVKKFLDPSLELCPECHQKFRTRPKSRKHKDKYQTFQGY